MKRLDQFYLLMWKQWKLRTHRYGMTAAEILLPIIIGYLLCSQGGKFLISTSNKHGPTIGPVSSTKFFVDPTITKKLVYTPKTYFTDKIIDKVKALTKVTEIKGVANEEELEKLVSSNVGDFSSSWIGVVFSNADPKVDKPTDFSYSMRDTHLWNTKALFYESDSPEPYALDPYVTNGFAGVQMALDTAFIQLRNPSFDFSKKYFQAFPYPEYQGMNLFRSYAPTVIFYVVIVTSLILSVPLIVGIIEEKESGVKELMKLSDVEEWLLQLSWFVSAIIFSFISFTIVTILLSREFQGPGSSVLLSVPSYLVWLCIILYCISNIAFCFTFSAIFYSPTVASSVFMLVFILLTLAVTKVKMLHSVFLTRLMCIFPMGAFYQGFQRIAFFENHQQSVTWDALTSGKISLLFVFLMLILDTFLYLLLSSYITAINPGSFGIAKSPLFFMEKFRKPPETEESLDESIDSKDETSDKYFEKPPDTLNIGLRIKDLHKKFRSLHAVRGVNLNVYQGEITALLGHNGAGKTTTMAIITGMTNATSGSITYKDELDVLNEMDVFRQNLGLCPQENRLLSYLSVINHLVFFGRLKGASKEVALEEGTEYLRLMEMESQSNSLIPPLSGGMKRQVCLAMSLMGKVETLILDEPTSGMDVESRRKVWDLLLELRGNRTIILTTHHMEEADVLGDRIAIMNHGKIVCHGTSMFLKKAYGTGYEMTISTDGNKEEALTSTIQRLVPGSEKEHESASGITYKLPLTETAKFAELFYTLEQRKDEFGVKNIGIACTTMDRVFLKVGEISINGENQTEKEIETTNDEMIFLSSTEESSERKKTGLFLVFQQLIALFWKKCLLVKGNQSTFFFRIVLPTLMMMLLFYAISFKLEPSVTLTLSTYPHAKVMMSEKITDSSIFDHTFNYVERKGGTVLFSNNKNIIAGLLDYGRNFLYSLREELVIGTSYNSTHNLGLYNKFAYHSLPILINTISNVELELASTDSATITAMNHPLKEIKEYCDPLGASGEVIFIFLFLAFYSIELCNYFSTFLSVERIDGFKHIQLMSNVSPLVYWISNIYFDFIFFFAVLILRIILIKLIDDEGGFLAIEYDFGILLLLLIGFIIGGLLFTYIINFTSKSKDGSYALLLIVNVVTTVAALAVYFIEQTKGMGGSDESDSGFSTSIFYSLLKYIVLLIPTFNYSLAFMKFTQIRLINIAANNPICKGQLAKLDYLVFASPENKDGLLQEFIFMIINAVLYSVLLALIELGYLSRLANIFIKMMLGEKLNQSSIEDIDPDVAREKDFVTSYDTQDFGSSDNTVLLVRGLTKVYLKKMSLFFAVKDINFSVKSGECFGLLGVSGAGKSTSFKMMTGAELPTEGDSSIMNTRLSEKTSQYMSKAGYCAQTNGIIGEMTGREMVRLIAKLRGIHSDDVDAVVDKWLTILGLEFFQNQKCGSYSGGNKRKLCTAMALIGGPNVVFLDEPTAGVDPVSRRKLHDVMQQSRSSGQAVVLTSHSMEECEALCDRLTIMSRGQMKCIGTSQQLKQQFAQGFSVMIKTSSDNETDIKTLKNSMSKTFGETFAVVKDEHKGLLQYQIQDIRLKWSQLFEKMETIKRQYEFVEDYTVTDTSLEEVFMSFVKQAENEQEN